MTAIPKPTPRGPKPPTRLLGRWHRVSNTTRLALIARSPICQWCKEPGGRLDPHHRLALSQGGTDALDNLASLHRKCHRYLHEHPIEARKAGLIVARSGK